MRGRGGGSLYYKLTSRMILKPAYFFFFVIFKALVVGTKGS